MKARLTASNCFWHLLAISFAQWHYRSQWGVSEARLLLIAQYPARRLEIQSALQFLSDRSWTLQKKNKYVAPHISGWVSEVSEYFIYPRILEKLYRSQCLRAFPTPTLIVTTKARLQHRKLHELLFTTSVWVLLRPLLTITSNWRCRRRGLRFITLIWEDLNV